MGTSEGGNNAEVVRVAAQRFPLDAHHRRGRLRLRKAKAKVKLLALALGHRLHRERVLDLLWPNFGRLRQALYVALTKRQTTGYARFVGARMNRCKG